MIALRTRWLTGVFQWCGWSAARYHWAWGIEGRRWPTIYAGPIKIITGPNRDFPNRAAEKQAARVADEQAVAKGRKSREVLMRENSFLRARRDQPIDFKRIARIK